MTFGERFKELRLDKNLKQQELADNFNRIYGYTFSKSSISQYENNKRRPETDALIDFAKYFNVSIDYLVGLSENKNPCVENEVSVTNKDILDNIKGLFLYSKINRKEKDLLFKNISNLYFESLFISEN